MAAHASDSVDPSESYRGGGGADEDVRGLKGPGEVAVQDGAQLLRLLVVGIGVPRAQGEGAQQNALLHLLRKDGRHHMQAA